MYKLRFNQEKCPSLFIKLVLLQLDKKARADQETETKIVKEIEKLWKEPKIITDNEDSEITINNGITLIKKLESIFKDLKSVDNNNKKKRNVSCDEIEK